MFGGNKYSAIFRSRWRAVFWALGVMLTAYCTVPSEGGNDPALDAATDAVGALAGTSGREDAEAEPRHVNPWALPPEEQRH